LWSECDRLCFLSKNLYNAANYIYRQDFFAGRATDATLVYSILKEGHDYKAIPAKVSQGTLKLVLKAWQSYRAAMKAYKENPEGFAGSPKIPGYKGTRGNRSDGRYVVVYNNQAVSKRALKKGIAHPSGSDIYLPTKVNNISEMRIVPKAGTYIIEIVCVQKADPKRSQGGNSAAIDIGLNNLATLAYSNASLRPQIFDGRAIKSVNQYANQRNAELRAKLPEGVKTSKRLVRLWEKRNSKMEWLIHQTSSAIVKELVKNSVSQLAIGYSPEWKDEIDIGTASPKTFVSVSHHKLVCQLQYKCALKGIEVLLVDERYTSKCSSLDSEPIQKQENYLGVRIKRGLFRSGAGRLINADLNAAYNLGRKVFGNGFVPHPIEALVVAPVRVKPYKQVNRAKLDI
jgi:IS605 OrfB family transposase